MRKVLIIGCGGSGKSTLARELGKLLMLPVVHLDQLFWLAGWVEKEKEIFDRELEKALREDCWIIDGNYLRTLPKRLCYCDTVIFLDYPVRSCLWGVLCRVLHSYGRTRPDMGAGCPERLKFSFLRWVCAFRKRERPKCYAALADFKGKQIVLKNRRECRNFLVEIRKKKQQKG